MKIIFIKVQPHPNGYGFQRPNPPDPNIVSGYRKLLLFFAGTKRNKRKMIDFGISKNVPYV